MKSPHLLPAEVLAQPEHLVLGDVAVVVLVKYLERPLRPLLS